MTDLIGKLQSFAYLVPDEYKAYISQIKQFCFKLKGFKYLQNHPFVPLELQLELKNFVCAVENCILINGRQTARNLLRSRASLDWT